MTSTFDNIKAFFGYWYLRYQLATELYMVEPWEKGVIHVLYLIVFALLSYFNTSVVLSGVASLRNAILSSLSS